MSVDECPGTATLEALLLGRLEDAQAAPLEDHLLSCPRCTTKAKSVVSHDTLVDAMREYRPRPAEELAAVERIVDRLRPVVASSASVGVAEIEKPEDSTDRASGKKGLFARLERVVGNDPARESPDMHDADLYDFLEPAQSDDELGRLGLYRVLEVIGSGGMGVVFMAEDPALKRRVALKAMHPPLAASAGARERFMREAQATAAIEHDHIVSIYQVDKDRGIPYIAMPLLRGETLDERLDRRPKQTVAETLRIGREIAAGLAAAKAQGLIHRDIKPANIWLEETTGRVKILDFGLARSTDDDSHLTKAGAIVGTPQYMSPEQAAKTDVDHRSDLFSLGCVLYRMSTGAAPFVGADHAAILDSVANEDPPAPRTLRPQTPGELSDLIVRLLSKDREARPASAITVVEAIEQIEAAPQQAEPPKIDASLSVRSRANSKPRFGPRVALAAVVLAMLLPLSYYAFTIIVSLTHGQLVIESDDQAVEVTIKHSERKPIIEIIDRQTKRQIYLKPGDYQLEVTIKDGADETNFSTDKFTLKRGGREILNVRRELAKRKATPPPAVAESSESPFDGVSEPQPLAEWLEGRTIVTVAQNGSGDYRTISAALANVWDGQVIEVLDQGPYTEALRDGLPANVGLFSRVRTSVVIPDWSQGGCSLSCADGFRLAGFDIHAPVAPKELESADILHLRGAGDIVVEDCRLIYDPQIDNLPPWRNGPARDLRKVIRFTPTSRMRATIQDNHVEATIRFDDEFDGEILIQRNRVLAYEGVVTPEHADRIVIRHNYLHAGNSIVWRTLAPEEASTSAEAPHLICNNVLDSTHPPMLVRINNVGHQSSPDEPPMAKHVWVLNNLLRAAFSGGVLVAKADWETLKETWRVDYNCYLNGTRDFGGVISIPLADNDRVLSSPYLSLDPIDPNYYRISEDTGLGVSGAGNAISGLPKFIGPVPAGPAAEGGDWLSRLLVPADSPAGEIENAEPPPLAEWTEDREVITVAQNGSGDYTKIHEALANLKPGQVVKVLDRGPYRERLNVKLPPDVALVSEVGTVLELPEWQANRSQRGFYSGHNVVCSGELRLSGFQISSRLPQNQFVASLLSIKPYGKLTIDGCRFLQQPRASLRPSRDPLSGSRILVAMVVFESDVVDDVDMLFDQNVFEGAVELHNPLGSTIVQRNYFTGWTSRGIHVKQGGGRTVIRHNIIRAVDGIVFSRYPSSRWKRDEAEPEFRISNNVIDAVEDPIRVRISDEDTAGEVALQESVRIENNILRSQQELGIGVPEELWSVAQEHWIASLNCYAASPRINSVYKPIPLSDTDLVQDPEFLSEDTTDLRMYARIRVDSPLADAAASPADPYIGALPPGPALHGAEWFSRLLADAEVASRSPAAERSDVPDFSSITPLLDNLFKDASSRVGIEGSSDSFDRLFENNRHVLIYKKDTPYGMATFPVIDLDRDFACETIARAKGRDSDGWGLYVIDAEQQGVGLKLSRDGRLEIRGSYKNVSNFPGTSVAPIIHPAIKRGDEDNKLLVMLRNGKLSVYVNSVAVCNPIELDASFKPTRLLLAARPASKGARAEFQRVTVWPVDKLDQ
jgi:serine/threonine protein kinase